MEKYTHPEVGCSVQPALVAACLGSAENRLYPRLNQGNNFGYGVVLLLTCSRGHSSISLIVGRVCHMSNATAAACSTSPAAQRRISSSCRVRSSPSRDSSRRWNGRAVERNIVERTCFTITIARKPASACRNAVRYGDIPSTKTVRLQLGS